MALGRLPPAGEAMGMATGLAPGLADRTCRWVWYRAWRLVCGSSAAAYGRAAVAGEFTPSLG
ncbi:MAG: hypothetical protein KF864_11830 [Phycisphaeraceae bacterium]|nr:hypothetical protein [Phycisphaeraceae bacterium]